MSQWTSPSLFQIIDFRFFGSKPVSKEVILIGSPGQILVMRETKWNGFRTKNSIGIPAYKMATVSSRLQCIKIRCSELSIPNTLNNKISLKMPEILLRFLPMDCLQSGPVQNSTDASSMLSAPDGPHVGPMNLAIRESSVMTGYATSACSINQIFIWSLIQRPEAVVKHFYLPHSIDILSTLSS